MLPFPNRKGQHDDVLELDDEDLVLVEASPLAPEAIQSIRKSVSGISAFEIARLVPPPPPASVDVLFTPVEIEIAQPAPPDSVVVPITRASRSSRESCPRLVWDADAEDDVADECLASIAEQTSKTRLSDPFLFAAVPPPARRERKDVVTAMSTMRRATIPPPASSSSIVAVRVPKASAPPQKANPWERRDSAVWARKSRTNETDAPGSPALPSLFARATPTPGAPKTVSTLSTLSALSSVPPPVTMPSAPPKGEPTVILLRERPRSVWVLGSAAIGALCAVTAMHFIAPWAAPQSPPPTVVAVPAPPPPPPTTIVAPPATTTATTATTATPIPTVNLKATPAVVSFGDDQGVAIAKPKPKPPAPKAAPTVMVPDTATAKVEPPPPPPPPKPKRPLTPEQELSEAQLKAALRQ